MFSWPSMFASFLKYWINTKVPETKHVAEFANSVDPDQVAHDELPCLDLHCLPPSL